VRQQKKHTDIKVKDLEGGNPQGLLLSSTGSATLPLVLRVSLTYALSFAGFLRRIMKEHGLVSTYTVAQYKPNQAACNKATTTNTLNREFDQTEAGRFVVSDLTYVKVQNQWKLHLCACRSV
jgi:hypothetical protein